MVLKVMVVDDNRLVRSMLSQVLSEAGFVSIEAESVIDALAKLSDELIDIFIIDYHLVDINGDELVRRLRSTSRYKSTPIIGLSGLVGSAAKLVDAGVSDFIPKPINKSLVGIINKHLRIDDGKV